MITKVMRPFKCGGTMLDRGDEFDTATIGQVLERQLLDQGTLRMVRPDEPVLSRRVTDADLVAPVGA